jgi:lipopolysaccharide export system permease protein
VTRYDRYVLSQYLLVFGFFALVLVGMFWVNQAVSLFDRLIGDGQSALVFLEFTLLALPTLTRTVAPMAIFGAVVYVTNRQSGDSELTVMQATGSGGWRLARPAMVFGLLMALFMSVVTHGLRPASIQQLTDREAELSQNIAARLLTEGSFLNPTPGVTFYIRAIDTDGTLRDVFLSDRRDPTQVVTFTAARAFLVRADGSSSLIMVDGLAQRLDVARQTLSTTLFEDLSYDISALIARDGDRVRNIRAVSTYELLAFRDELIEDEGFERGRLVEELHQRFSWATICFAVALVGVSTLMLGAYSRFGVWRQALLAFVLLVLLEMLRGIVTDPVIRNPQVWPLLYLPSLLGVAISAAFLQMTGRPVWLALRLPRRAPPDREAPA